MRQEFLNNVLNCVNIKYHHQGRNEAGLDCAGLLVYAMKKTGVYKTGDYSGYSVNPDGVTLLKCLKNNLQRIDYKDKKSGDVLLMRFDTLPQHIAIYYVKNDEEFVIHSFLKAKKVVVERYEQYKNNIVAVFKIPEFED